LLVHGYIATKLQSTVKTVLILFCPFAPVHTQDAQISTSAHRVLPAVLLQFYSWNSATKSSSCCRNNSYPQILRLSTKEDCPQKIS
jgi:hypothetical protein